MTDSSFRHGGLCNTGGLLSEALERLGVAKRVAEQRLLARWPEIAGVRIASVTRADRIANGKLFVSCKTSAWANELTMLKTDLLRKIRKLPGGGSVEDIRFSSIGYGRKVANTTGEQRDPVVQLSKDDEEFVAEVVALVNNPDLAERVRRAIIASRWRNAARLAESVNDTDWKG
jgi:hypothetical protein